MVKPIVIWENVAKGQLKDLYNYIKQDSLQNAINVRNDIVEKVKKAAAYPELFSPDKYNLINDGSYRAFELHRYRVSYRTVDKQVIVLRIRHTSQSPLPF